jgi:hypothetical protein
LKYACETDTMAHEAGAKQAGGFLPFRIAASSMRLFGIARPDRIGHKETIRP